MFNTIGRNKTDERFRNVNLTLCEM